MHANFVSVFGSIFGWILVRFGLQNGRKFGPESEGFWSLFSMSIPKVFLNDFFDNFVSMVVLRRCHFWCRTLCFSVLFWFGSFARKLWKVMRMTSKIVLKIDQKSMKNRPKMGPKINIFSDCLGDGCRLRFGADLGTILGPMLGRFSDPKSKKNMLKKYQKNDRKKVVRSILGHASRPPAVP